MNRSVLLTSEEYKKLQEAIGQKNLDNAIGMLKGQNRHLQMFFSSGDDLEKH